MGPPMSYISQRYICLEAELGEKMFVLSNGAFKSGSTWLWTIVGATGRFKELPREYGRGKGKIRAFLKPEKIGDFLESGIYKSENYWAKGHFFDKRSRDLFLSHDSVYIFNIKRDIKDSLVSHYYHLIRQNKLSEQLTQPENLKKGFSDYYWRFGRYKAQQLMIYHKVWDIPSPKVYVSSFERLKNDYENEVKCIGQFLDLHLSTDEIARIKDVTSIQNVQKAKGLDKLPEHKRFIRKGLIGESKQFFSDDMRNDVEGIIHDGLGKVDMIRYRAIFTTLSLRRKLLKH